MAGSASFTSSNWEYRPNYFAVWTGLPGCEWEYYRLNRPGGKPGLVYKDIPIRNSYTGPVRYAVGIWMHGNNACYLLTPKQLARGRCVSSRNTSEEMRTYLADVLSQAQAQSTVDIALGSANLATAQLTSAIDRLKATYPELAS